MFQLRDPDTLQMVAASTSPLLVNTVKHVLDGLVAGGMGAAVVYPIDVIKTRLQMQGCEDFECDISDDVVAPSGMQRLRACFPNNIHLLLVFK